MADTENVLIRYGMCLSLCEMAINTQFELAWAIWLKAGSIDDTIRIERSGTDQRSYILTAEFDSPSLSLTGGRQGRTDLKVTLTISSGTVTIMPDGRTIKLDGATVTFPVDLKNKSTSVDQIGKIDPDIAERAQEIVDAARRNDGIAYDKLSIESLLLDLSKPSAIQAGMDICNANGKPFPAEQAEIIADCFGQLFRDGAKRDCILGTLVHVKPEAKRRSTLIPTSFTHNIFTDASDSRVNSLDYLGNFDGVPLPTGEDRRAGIFGPWLDPRKIVSGGMTAGVMAIRGEDFSGLIFDALRDALYPQQTFRSQHSAEFFTHWQNIQIYEGNALEYDSEIRQDMFWHIGIRHEPERGEYDIDIRIDVVVHLGLTHRLLSDFQGRWSSSARSRLTLILEEKNDEELGFSLATRLSPARPQFDKGKVRFDEVEHSWTRDVDRAIGKVLGQGSPEERCERETEELIHHLSNALSDAFSRVEMRLANFEFIPPGDQEFVFTTPRFSPRGDLLLDVKYRSPVIVE